MKKSWLKKWISFILFFVIMFNSNFLTNALGTEFFNYANEDISGKIIFTENNKFDYSNIRLNVFKLEEYKKDELCSQYNHIYLSTISPSTDGEIIIKRPSDYCYIEVDKDSIPSGYGIKNDSFLISIYEKGFSLKLFSIKSFDYDILNNTSNYYNEKKESLFVNSKYQIKYNTNIIKKALLNDNEIDVKCVFNDFSMGTRTNTNDLLMTDRINFLFENNYINEEEKINLYINNLQRKRINKEPEIIKALSEIKRYKENNNMSENMNKRITRLVNSFIPSYENETIYTYRFFTIHYESGTMSNMNLAYLALSFQNAYASLCNTLCFSTPNLFPDESTYNVYITSGQNYEGLTIPVVDSNMTYTFINININDGMNPISNYTLGTTYHEFMHAIQFQYNSYKVNQHYNEMVSFNEAVANSIGVRFVSNFGIKDFVDIFQNSPELSLLSLPESGDYQYRCYGAVLFPLCIEQEYSNLHTIRRIYEEMYVESINDRDVYTAIDTALQQENGCIQHAYKKCALFNYNIQNYYNYCESNWQTCPKLSNITTNSTTYTNTYLSTRYYEITDSTYSGFAVSFNSSNNINDAMLQRVDTISGQLFSTNYSIFSQNMTAIFYIQPGKKICMILSNKSLLNDIAYSVRVLN